MKHGDVLDAAEPEDEVGKKNLCLELKRRANGAVKASPEEAVLLYDRAIELRERMQASLFEEPATYALYSNRSMALLNMGKAGDALRDARVVTHTNPDFAKGHWRVSAALEKQKKYGPAYDACKECLQRSAGKEATRVKTQADKLYRLACQQLESGDAPAADEAKLKKPRSKAKAKAAEPKAAAPAAEGADATNDGDEEKIRGYKLNSSGVKTSFFDTEITAEAKKLLAAQHNEGGKRVNAQDVSATNTGAGSVWNAAQTFEERDRSPWACLALTKEFADGSGGITFEVTSTATKKKDKEHKITGDASICVIKGSLRKIFDVSGSCTCYIVFCCCC